MNISAQTNQSVGGPGNVNGNCSNTTNAYVPYPQIHESQFPQYQNFTQYPYVNNMIPQTLSYNPHQHNEQLNILKEDMRIVTKFMDKYLDNNEQISGKLDRTLDSIEETHNRVEQCFSIYKKIDTRTKNTDKKLKVMNKRLSQLETINDDRKTRRAKHSKVHKPKQSYKKDESDDEEDCDHERDSSFLSQIMGTNNEGKNKEVDDDAMKAMFMMNPITALMNAMNSKNNESKEEECINSEDEESSDTNVFSTEADLCIEDNEFEALDCKITSIDDIIELGQMFKIPKKELSPPNADKKTKKKHIIFNAVTGTVHIADDDADTKEDFIKKIVEYNEEKDMYKFKDKYYSIDPVKLNNLVKPLAKLKNMIGLKNIKDSVLDFITHYLQRNHHDKMLHTVLEGPPGVGKTRLGKILAEIYSAMGVIPSARCKLVTRNDLIGQYAGETTKKTQKQLDDAEGGVLFIDEAYALGADGKDTYSKECINCINQNLSEKKKKLIVIIAGYGDALQRYFFAQNEGLSRRFPFRYKMTGYNETEMKDIFISFLRRKNLKLHYEIKESDLVDIFKTEKSYLVNYGGDIENIVNQCELLNDRLKFGTHPKNRNVLTLKTVKHSIEKYKSHANMTEDNTSWKQMFI